jgi:uroporphyrinogen-III synthase
MVAAMTARRILITRSEPGASQSAERLLALGYQPIVEPLFTLEAIPAMLPMFDALAFTSANGVRAFAGLSQRRDAAVYCVGQRTADVAREAGFTEIKSADGDVEALLKLIEQDMPATARLLHTGNEDSRGDLAGQLKAGGRDATFIATYRAAAIAAPDPVLYEHLFGRASFDAVLIHSPRAADILAGFVAAWPAHAAIDVAAMSEAAARPLRPHADGIEVATQPTEGALLEALARLFS